MSSIPFPAARRAIITGGNGDIGFHAAVALCRAGFVIHLPCKTYSKAVRACALIAQTAAVPPSNVIPEVCDLSSLASVRAFSSKFRPDLVRSCLDGTISPVPVHLLVLCAGVLSIPQWTPTIDGYETHFQINFLSHAVLTELLLPCLIAGSGGTGPGVPPSSPFPSRIVVVSSKAHEFGRKSMCIPSELPPAPPRTSPYSAASHRGFQVATVSAAGMRPSAELPPPPIPGVPALAFGSLVASGGGAGALIDGTTGAPRAELVGSRSDLRYGHLYFPFVAYGNSKILLIMYVRALAQRLRAASSCYASPGMAAGGNALVTAYSIHPGIINSGIARYARFPSTAWALYALPPQLTIAFGTHKPPAEGAAPIVRCALDPALGDPAVSGMYFSEDCQPKRPKVPSAEHDRDLMRVIYRLGALPPDVAGVPW
eukprot:TRINITY_DN32895_c0_g1_i1.p1 TRINITY_DN32895_c0_g1~~TRINITY_DN32895_c0_g1_i1.p1  ORF type:complete len:482 (-),score=13.90 TRINITY_DN32895_c0_g1_i1:394-1674(-)